MPIVHHFQHRLPRRPGVSIEQRTWKCRCACGVEFEGNSPSAGYCEAHKYLTPAQKKALRRDHKEGPA